MTGVRVATRASALARTQSQTIADLLTGLTGEPATLVEVRTHGDVDQSTPLAQMGGVGVFVVAVREAVVNGDADVAVHSLKDLPTAMAQGLTIAAVPARADAHDVLIARDGLTLETLPAGARVGTGSPRRSCQIQAIRPDLDVVPIRGNVDTRIALVGQGVVDAVVLAKAGLERLGRLAEVSQTLDFDVMLPAPGQGALAVESRLINDDERLTSALADLDHPQTRLAVTAERALLAALEAGCSAPVGAYATITDEAGVSMLHLAGLLGMSEGTGYIRKSVTGFSADAEALGRQLANELLSAMDSRTSRPVKGGAA
jgi:hydroxymethylbilane synthase